ncbi:hypothetical protein L7F22_030757 [Adiantum nelumboides]|nr:hypothetical protein [Adiantum nelumboides]
MDLRIINLQGSFLQDNFLEIRFRDNSLFGHATLDKRPFLKQDPLPTVLGIEDGLAKTGDVMTAEIFKGRLLLDNMLLLLQHHPPLSQVDQDYAPFAVVIIGDKGKQAVRAVRVSKVVSVLMLNANTNVSVPVNLSNQVLSLLGFVGNHPLNVLVDSGCSTNFCEYNAVMDELLYYLDRICVPHNGALRKILIQEHHEVPFVAHRGINKTYRLLSATYFWPQMQQDVIKYVKACHSCQIMKASRQLPQGLLQPLPVPKERWESISMDFITTLPRTSKGNAQILVIVDRFSKMAHFIPCKKAASAPDIASLFVQHIFRIHGLPRSIISDRDPKFTGHFWTSLFKSLGTNLLFSSAYHPQTDGQTERVNQILEEMLRHYIQNCLASWEEYLPLVEFAYNNAPHSVTGMTPFQAAYGHTPLVPTNFVLQHKVALADQLVQEMQDILVQVRDKLVHVQQKYQKQANKHRRHAEFNEDCFDDDNDVAYAEIDYSSDEQDVPIQDDSGWSTRSRNVGKYLKTVFQEMENSSRRLDQRATLGLERLLARRTKREAARMFFETLVLKTKDYIHVEQNVAYQDIQLYPNSKLMKTEF